MRIQIPEHLAVPVMQHHLPEQLQPNGKVLIWMEREFDYVCLAPAEAASLGFEEHRSNLKLIHPLPDGTERERFVLTSGFASAPLTFHPLNQFESTFRYLGRQRVNDQEMLVLAFAQHPTAKGLTCDFRNGDRFVEARTCGIVWVDPSTHHISRMRTDLLRRYPEVGLDRITTDIFFTDVRFDYLQSALWLPVEVVVTVEWERKTFRNSHRYSNFQLFTAESKTKQRQPKLHLPTTQKAD